MKQIVKKIFLVFVICLVINLLYLAKQEIAYYSMYTWEELKGFLNIPSTIWFYIKQALSWSGLGQVASIPTIILLHKTNIHPIAQIVLAIFASIIFLFGIFLFALSQM